MEGYVEIMFPKVIRYQPEINKYVFGARGCFDAKQSISVNQKAKSFFF